MAGNIASLQRPNVQYAPSVGVTSGTVAQASQHSRVSDETDRYLRSSYALVDHLRRAVAERASSLR